LALIAIAVTSLGSVACGKPAERLVGTWELDSDAFVASDEVRKFSKDEIFHWLGEMRRDIGNVEIVLTHDTFVQTNHPLHQVRKTTGRYVVRSERDDRVTIEATTDGTGEKRTMTLEGETLWVPFGKHRVAMKKK
jgi:hypothetical protein